jgi:hypothetical protein
MLDKFSTEYAHRTDHELLHFASDRDSLTMEAASALDAELQRRNLTEADLVRHQEFVARVEKRDALRRRQKIFGKPKRDPFPWFEMFCVVVVMAFIWIIYAALPDRFHMSADWEKSMPEVMFASVATAGFGNPWWRKITFWMSWAISSAINLVIAHAWLQRVGKFSRWQGDIVVLLGFVLFFFIFALVSFLRRSLLGEDVSDHA